MRVVEHRRHSRRDPGDPHLSREGLELARRVAPTLGRFDRVVSSPKRRAIETAEALGFSVDAEVPDLALMPDDVGPAFDELNPRSFAEYVRAAARNRSLGEYARRQAKVMREELSRVPDGGRLLIVSHGGVIEFGAAAARSRDAMTWGEPTGYLEGVRLTLERGRWVRGEVLRVSK